MEDHYLLYYFLYFQMLYNNNNVYFNNDGSLKRYYLNIDDLSKIIVQIFVKEISGIYNIIGKDFLTIKDVVSKSNEISSYFFNVLKKTSNSSTDCIIL